MIGLISIAPVFYGDGVVKSLPEGVRFLPGEVQVGEVRLLLDRPVSPKGRTGTGGYVSFHRGSKTYVFPAYRQVMYDGVWEGVSLIFTPKEDGSLEMQFVLEPGVSPDVVALHFNHPLRYDDGSVKVGDLTLGNFHAYQGSEEVEVYPVIEGNTLRFKVPDYDPTLPLVIDPDLGAVSYARLFGGNGSDYAQLDAMEVAPDGSIYVLGYTYSADFDFGSASGYDMEGDTLLGDLFLLRLNSSLQIVSATYIGLPDEYDVGLDWVAFIGPAIGVDTSGNVFVAFGHTSFPVPPGGYQDTSNSSFTRDVVILKLSPDLTTILAGTYFGGTSSYFGNGDDDPLILEVTPSGKVVIAGITDSDDLPTAGGAIPTPPSPDSTNGFVAVFSNDLSTLIGATYFGTNMDDFKNGERWMGLAVGPSEEIYVSFTAKSGSLPVVGGRSYAGGPSDIYVMKLSPDLGTILASTYLGGSFMDGWTLNVLIPMEVDGDGNLVLASTTHSADFPVVGGYDSALGGVIDAVVVKLSSDLSTILASTYIGGDTTTSTSCHITGFNEAPADIEIDENGFVYIGGGLCYVPDFPTSPSAYDRNWGGDQDGFVAKFYPNLNLLRASTYYAWPGHQEITSIELLPDGRLVVLGFADSNAVSGFPWEGFSGSPYGSMDVFLAVFENSTAVSERVAAAGGTVEITPKGFLIRLTEASYVGWDLYSADGRRLESGTLGFVPAGEYEVSLKVPTGTYLLKVRLGGEVRALKLLGGR